MWVWISDLAEAIDLDGFAIGDEVDWACHELDDIDVDIVLPADLSGRRVLYEDADCRLVPYGGDHLDVRGTVVSLRVGSLGADGGATWVEVGRTDVRESSTAGFVVELGDVVVESRISRATAPTAPMPPAGRRQRGLRGRAR